jgi:hypothetical protein
VRNVSARFWFLKSREQDPEEQDKEDPGIRTRGNKVPEVIPPGEEN